jgi:hypothetical protein
LTNNQQEICAILKKKTDNFTNPNPNRFREKKTSLPAKLNRGEEIITWK